MTEPVDLELLRDVLAQIDETGSYPVGGSDADELVKAARAYAAMAPRETATAILSGDPPMWMPKPRRAASPQLLADLANMCHIMKTNQAHNAGTPAADAFKKMHDITAEALALLSPTP